MAALESDDDLETTENDVEYAEVEDIVLSDTDEGNLLTDQQTRSIMIDSNSRIILKSKEARRLQKDVESDSCTTQFHIGNVDFPSMVEEISGNVSSSEELDVSDDDTKLISRTVDVNSLDLHSFVSVKSVDNSAGLNKFTTEAQGQSEVETKDPNSTSISKLPEVAFHQKTGSIDKKKYFYANLHGLRLSHFKPKSSATMFNEFLQSITDENDDDDVFEPVDGNVPHTISGEQFKQVDDTELEELTLTTESDGKISLSQNIKPQLRHRFNRPYRQDGFDDSETTTYAMEHPNIHTDDEISSDGTSLPVARKTKKSRKKKDSDESKNQSDDESTEEEEFFDDSDGKELLGKPSRKIKKEWTETDESGGLKQVTRIRTETSIKVIGDEDSDDDGDVVRTTTTTRIVTTVTTDDDVVQEEGGDELRRSMEEVLNQFMTEEKTQDASSAKQ